MLDHLVYATPDLPATLDWFEANTGLRPRPGGRHPDHGTRNALLNLGNRSYLEIIAADPENPPASGSRWMGLDGLDRPRMTRWCVSVPDLDEAADLLRHYNPAMGQRSEGQRRTPDGQLLRWQMLLPLAAPRTEIIPFCIDWRRSDRHPTDGLPVEVELLDLRLYHPNPDTVQPLLEQFLPGTKVATAMHPLIAVSIQTPKGVVML